MTVSNHRITQIFATYSMAIFAFLILCAAYSKTILEISTEWSGTGTYSHGFLALAIAGYIVWQNRGTVSNTRFDFQPIGIIAIVGAGFLWLAAALVNVQFVQVFSLFAIILATMVCLFGWRSLWELRVALLALLLVLPIWNFLQVPLQELSSDVTEISLKALGIPTLREGFKFTVPGGQFLVEEACAGLSFFLSSCLLGVLFVSFNHVVGMSRYYFFLFAVLLSLVSNWIRILVVIVVGNYTQMDHIIVQDHLTFGWILYAVMLIPFFVVGHYFTQAPKTGSDETKPVNPEVKIENGKVQPKQMLLVTALVIGVIVAFPFVRLVMNQNPPETVSDSSYDTALRQLTKPTKARLTRLWEPHFAGASAIKQTTVTYNDQVVGALFVTYSDQAQGKELIHVRNTLYSKHSWNKQSSQYVELEVQGTTTKQQLLKLKDRRGTQRFTTYWYHIGGRITTSEREAKIFELLGILGGDRSAQLYAFTSDTLAAGKTDTEVTDKLLKLSSELQIKVLADSKS